jgi:ribosome-binding protein aMBF1 (putative translation factor)
MLERTRKRPTDTTELRYRGPVAKRDEAARILKDLGFVDVSENVPWREAFAEYADEDLPAVSLRAARRREGLTQKELADLSSIPQAHISLMERGMMPIGVTRAKRLGKALNTGYKMFL